MRSSPTHFLLQEATYGRGIEHPALFISSMILILLPKVSSRMPHTNHHLFLHNDPTHTCPHFNVVCGHLFLHLYISIGNTAGFLF